MDELYRLIFRGEVLEGQHSSVVKRRLKKSLKLDEAQAEKLFSGGSVVVQREADTSTAARFQALFKEAGARLRVMSVEPADVVEAPLPDGKGSEDFAASTATSDPTPGSTENVSAFDVLPAGSEVLTPEERQSHAVSEVNTDHLSMRDVGSDLGVESNSDPDGDPEALPEISHLSLAEVGADLHQSEEAAQSAENVVPDVDFEIAEVGSDVLPRKSRNKPEPDPVIDIAGYDLAEVGADIGQVSEQILPPAPDTSHLRLKAD